jgi:hypothetical protein
MIKRFLVAIVVSLMFVLPAFGANTLLDGVTSTGAGSAVRSGETLLLPANNYAVVVTYATAAPTAATVVLEGSIDGTNFVSMGSTTDVSAAVVGFSVADKPYPYIRGNLSAYTAGSCTGVTVKVETSQ